MKRIIFFDLDNTLRSTNKKEIPSKTVDLLKKLASTPNTFLGLATGRGPSKIHFLDDLIDLFTYKVFINGALAYKNNELIYDEPLKVKDIEDVVKNASKENISIGFVAKDREYVNSHNDEVDYGMKDFSQELPKIVEDIFLREPIYQLWLFSKDFSKIEMIINNPELTCYPWHNGGADLVNSNTNKAIAIKRLLENEDDYELITVGDGYNDIMMIEIADIGIAMENSRFDELKEKADYVAPHVDDNQLYDFFKKINLID
ncbi:MAG: Cof-type HAD-IIB family hydrolase [Acholeplasma sp.]|nr:Cof-type HAD-IIB family hydrolase [Acholeplasma sp.]